MHRNLAVPFDADGRFSGRGPDDSAGAGNRGFTTLKGLFLNKYRE
jgi:hypothetical protein